MPGINSRAFLLQAHATIYNKFGIGYKGRGFATQAS
jgi:hypothetical protein